jgi:anti-sigma-K factor RskA
MSPRDPDETELAAARSSQPQPDDTPDIALTRRLGAAARALSSDDLRLDDLPPGLWDRIEAGTEAGTTTAADAGAGPVADAAAARQRERTGEPASVVPIGDAPTRRRPARPARRRAAWLAAAVAAAVVVLAGTVALITRDDGGTTLAEAQLEPLPSALPGTGPAAATVVERDGVRELDLALDVPATSGFYEVWLIDEDIEGMVSLGPARTDGRYEIPPDVDIGTFPVVDVSIEPPDGVPTHSGVSALRGTLS